MDVIVEGFLEFMNYKYEISDVSNNLQNIDIRSIKNTKKKDLIIRATMQTKLTFLIVKN